MPSTTGPCHRQLIEIGEIEGWIKASQANLNERVSRYCTISTSEMAMIHGNVATHGRFDQVVWPGSSAVEYNARIDAEHKKLGHEIAMLRESIREHVEQRNALLLECQRIMDAHK